MVFVDEAGRYSPQGPDYEGQIRRLRSGDGVYFTKFGARKLALYVDREIQRTANRGMPVALRCRPTPRRRRQMPKPGGPRSFSGRAGSAADRHASGAGRVDRRQSCGVAPPAARAC
jgi:hypothetical protein